MTRVRIGALIFAAWIALLSGCNTMKGLGKDIETLGDNIQKKSSR